MKDIHSQYRVDVLLFHNSPVYVKFLLNKPWPVGWGVIQVHLDEPNVVCPFVNVFQGFYYLGSSNPALLSRLFYVCTESPARSLPMIRKFQET